MPSFEHVENCLRLLDSFLLGQWVDDEGTDMAKEALDEDRKNGLANELVALCTISELIMQSQDNDIGKPLVTHLMQDGYLLLASAQMHRDRLPSTPQPYARRCTLVSSPARRRTHTTLHNAYDHEIARQTLFCALQQTCHWGDSRD